jgi:hypothetical protein
MSKRWLGLLFFGVWIGGSGVAHAAITANPSTISIGTVTVAQSKSGTTNLSANPDVTITAFDMPAASCSEFTISPAPPQTVGNGGGGASTLTVTVTFRPTSAGDKSCMITARDAGGGALVTFTATGTTGD